MCCLGYCFVMIYQNLVKSTFIRVCMLTFCKYHPSDPLSSLSVYIRPTYENLKEMPEVIICISCCQLPLLELLILVWKCFEFTNIISTCEYIYLGNDFN